MKKYFLLLLILSFSGLTFAQGEDAGLKKSTTKTTRTTPKSSKSKSGATNKPKTTRPQPIKPVTTKKRDGRKNQKTKPVFASLSISVNEPNSEVFLTNDSGNVFEENSVFTGDDGSPLVVEELPAGTYSLTIRKNGYFNETRLVVLTAGKPGSISVTLRPAAAILSITSDVSGAAIEIENVGEFDTDVKNLLVKPGTYRVNVYKNGYKTFSRQAALNSAGQKLTVEATLERLPVENLLDAANGAYNQKNYWETIKIVRQVLIAEPDNPKANLLAGYAYYFSEKPSDAVYLLSRAVSFYQQVRLPVKIFRKKDGLQLPAGTLSFNRGLLEFQCPSNPSLNFSVAQAGVQELSEKVDNFGIAHIILKARGVFNGKNDRETVLIYPDRAVVKASKKDLSCANCQIEQAALYELMNRWQFSRWLAPSPGFAALMPSSVEFAAYQNENFTVKVPENWHILDQTSSRLFAAPLGAFIKVRDANNAENYNYSRGIEAFIRPNPNNLNLNQATESLLTDVMTGNPYLTLEDSSAVDSVFGKALVNKYSGVSSVSHLSENLTVYTAITPKGDLFVLITLASPDDKEEYQTIFRRILNSIKLAE